MTAELAWLIASSLISAAFAAGGAFAAVSWRFRALEGRVKSAEDAIVYDRMRLDRHIEDAHAHP